MQKREINHRFKSSPPCLHTVLQLCPKSCAQAPSKLTIANLSLVQIQSSIGHSDYVKRDQALKGLIQPLAGEYGMHNGQAQGQQTYDPTCDPLTPRAVL